MNLRGIMSHMNEAFETNLIGMTKTEAIGEILRNDMDFRIVSEDDWDGSGYTSEPDLTMVNLSVKNRKIVDASVG